MNVFLDFHHGDLYYSLYTLFEKRLGWKIFRPIGWDWFNNGYWKIAEPYGNARDTIGQYLDFKKEAFPIKKSSYGQNYKQDDIYYIWDSGHDYYHRAITFKTFQEMKFDVIVPTYEPHEQPYIKLKNLYQNKAALVSQMGNTGQKSILSNVIHSVPYSPKNGQRSFYYHQEIDLTTYFYVDPDVTKKKVYSVVNLYPYPEIYNSYRLTLSEVEMKYFGSGCPDGILNGSRGVAEKMREANIGWHLKPQGGLGHSSLGWLASGRPVVTNMSQMRSWGGDSLSLFEPGVTCIDIESYNIHDGCKKIRQLLLPEENIKWSQRVFRRFNDIINYEEEAKNLSSFILGAVNG